MRDRAPARFRAGAGRATSLLQVWSTPAGARIIVDGKPTGFRSPTSFPLPAGAHRITLSLAGHRNAEESVRLGPGDTLRVEAILTPLAAGSLGVGSVPDGATILIDGVPFDQRTPAVIPQLVVGTHTVQLRRKGFEDWSQAVVVTPSRAMEIQAHLAPSRSSCGTLAVQSQPPRAAIFLDGSPTGKVTPERLTDIPPGSHRVELLLEGFRPWRGTAVVREGHIENLLVSLRHLPAQEVGGARIETDPPGACVRLNGVVLRQKTPVDLAAAGARGVPARDHPPRLAALEGRTHGPARGARPAADRARARGETRSRATPPQVATNPRSGARTRRKCQKPADERDNGAPASCAAAAAGQRDSQADTAPPA